MILSRYRTFDLNLIILKKDKLHLGELTIMRRFQAFYVRLLSNVLVLA